MTASPERLLGRPSVDLPVRQRLLGSLSLPAILAIVLITFGGYTQSSAFLTKATWINILTTASFTGIVACFEGLVMISGGLDLSVGSSFLAGAMTSAWAVVHGHSIGFAILATFVVGGGVGLINGFLANYVGISPIIATLGTMFAVASVVQTLSGGMALGPTPDRFHSLGGGELLSVPYPVFIALGVAVVAHVLLEYTTFGPKLRGVGGNRGAMTNIGLNAKLLSTSVYVLCGAMASFSGLLQAANLGAGDPSFGGDLGLQAIAAVVIGGVSVFGAIGTVTGMVAGAILLSLITVAISLLHWSGTMQDFAVGSVMILAVSLDRLRRSQMFRLSARRTRATD